jgi:hypothetical protein
VKSLANTNSGRRPRHGRIAKSLSGALVLAFSALMAQGAGSDEIRLSDNLGGNEKVSDATSVAAPCEPMPLPNPAVFQGAAQAARTDTVTVTLPPRGKTEVKAVMKVNKVLLYTWKTDKGVAYVDFHGHSPDWKDKKAFVRYLEAKQGAAADSGSLVAPFSGEHGWYWENRQDHPVTITLTVTGYHDAVKKYGAL